MKYQNRYFQFIRGILIYFVIFIHCMYENYNPYANIFNIIIRNIINLGVPIFIFMAGYFTNKEKVLNTPKEYIKKRIKRLLIPLVIYSALYSFFYVIDNEENEYFIYHFLKKFLTFSSAPQLYYIIVLLQITILTPLILKFIKNKKIKCILYLITPIYLIVLGILKIVFKIDIPHYQFYFFGWIIYYLIGLSLSSNKYFKFKKIILIIVLAVEITINIVIYNLNNEMYYYVTSQLNIMNLLYVLSVIPLIIFASKKYRENKLTKIIEKVGDMSFAIYFIHYFIIKLLQKIVNVNTINFILYYIVLSTLTLVISCIIIKMLGKIKNDKLKKCLGL